MKYILMLFVSVLLMGCTITRVTTPTWKMTRISVLQQVAMPSLSVTTNGVVQIKGYANDGGKEELNALIESMLKYMQAMPK